MVLNIRELCQGDYNKQYLDILKGLSQIDPENVSKTDFSNFLDRLYPNHKIYVVEKDGDIVGSGTLIIEEKLIHTISKVGHIEDVVIADKYKGQKIGKALMTFLLDTAKASGCYKVTLYCDSDNIDFYTKCGLVKKEYQMVKYF